MKWVKVFVAIVCSLMLMLGATTSGKEIVSAQGYSREITIIAPYVEYEWWLISWASNQVWCVIKIDHEGLPTIQEVNQSCGTELGTAWWITPPCNQAITTQCSGLYIYQISSQQKEREVVIELPPALIWLNLEGCTLLPPENLCTNLPLIVLTGEEPLPNERIVSIRGTYDGQPFLCNSEICKLPLRPTPLQGSRLEFWAESSFGDTSEHFVAYIRVIDSGVSPAPGSSGWYVDIVSSQWKAMLPSTCGQIWEAFPPLGGAPKWLTTPEREELLASEAPYYYLAGRLIAEGLVDVSSCASGGLLPNGYADVCGLEKSRSMVETWQNQFDQRIISVAKDTGIPAQLMKNLFAQESQFWPGIFRVPYEFGLGQITDNGADSILLWNPAFFNQFCPLVLSDTACASGYLSLREGDRAILRGALALQAKADCPDCAQGVDLSNTNFSVALFANTLQANCAQVSRTVYTATNSMAGRVSTYEDLWRFTIANYHAGPGCTSYAIHQAWNEVKNNTGLITWEVVSKHFTVPCKGVIPYVEKITR